MIVRCCLALLAGLLPCGVGRADDSRDFDRAQAAVVRSAVARVAPSIVAIETIGGAQPIGDDPAATQPIKPGAHGLSEPGFRVADGPTTGLVWSADGWIVSSAFNFVRDPVVTTVIVPGRDAGDEPRRFVARLVARDHIRRIALLKIDATDLPVPQWTPTANCQAGRTAIACGRGFGAWIPSPGGNSSVPALFPDIRVGIVSAIGRRNGNALQTDAKTSPANYGGPIIDIEGRVLGLIVPMGMTGDALAGLEWYDSGIGFAVTHAAIDRVIEQLKSGTTIEPGRLGVVLADSEPGGCRVTGVAVPSPAHDRGIKKGDFIVGLDSQPIGDRMELQRRLSDRGAGETVELRIYRESSKQGLVISIRLARLADIGQTPPADDDEKGGSRGPRPFRLPQP